MFKYVTLNMLFIISIICQLFVIGSSDVVCCETKTFDNIIDARLAGYDRDVCETGECKTLSEKIKHIIVLMLENRSFDHMLGYLSATREDIDGCIPSMGIKCSNPLDPNDPTNKEVAYISNDATYEQPADPQHKLSEITYQIFGTHSLGNSVDYYPAPMNGFVKSYSNVLPNNGSFIMKSFDENSLPIMTSLANEFGLIDRWFAGIPGETQPNRVMAMRGHTNGFIRNSDVKALVSGFDGLNIFSMLDEYKRDVDVPWNVFSGDFPNVLSLKSVRRYPKRFYNISELYDKINMADLPLLSWVEPSYFDISCTNPSTSEHANQHDVRNEAVRKSSIWNHTLFFIYYDEHGGFFDHVPPPSCPNPDGVNSVETEYPYAPPFDFQRLGVRVPAILISPFIRKGTTNSVKAENGESQYCHSSLIHTIRKNYVPNAPPLSLRDEWSLTFEDLINLNSPRTDTPMVLYPDPIPEWRDCENYHNRKEINISDTQISEANLISGLLGKTKEIKEYMSDQATLGQFVKDSFREWLKKKLKEKLNVKQCKTVGCSAELCVDLEAEMSEPVCALNGSGFKCEYLCHDYQKCEGNTTSDQCEWVTNKGIDFLKYERCMTLCDEMDKLKVW